MVFKLGDLGAHVGTWLAGMGVSGCAGVCRSLACSLQRLNLVLLWLYWSGNALGYGYVPLARNDV